MADMDTASGDPAHIDHILDCNQLAPYIVSFQEIMDLLCTLFRENGTTFVISSHDPQMKNYTDRTVRFEDGKIEKEEKGEDSSRC